MFLFSKGDGVQVRRKRRRRRYAKFSSFFPIPLYQQLFLLAGAACLLLSSCGGSPSLLDPHGDGASHIAALAWLFFILAAIIFVITIALLLFALFRPRRRNDSALDGKGAGLFVGIGGVAIPLVILAILFGLTLHTMQALSAPAVNGPTINVIGHQYWWEVQYPDQGFATANEIHIPVGRHVRLELSTADVIHSFWVPQLQVKRDLIPGHANDLILEADQPGTYRGECAEFCGPQHAHMDFLVFADPPDRFDTWLTGQERTPPQPTDPALQKGYQVFIGAACSYCHTVRGTNATAKVGPDLTHIASRTTLAAGMLENSRGSLAGWITNPQTIKPENKMPDFHLDGPDLQALLDYLESLQ